MHTLFIICAVLGGAILSVIALGLTFAFALWLVFHSAPDFEHSAAIKRWQ
jgi:hypothetical protein